MVHVHGRAVAQPVAEIECVPADRRLLAPVDVGKHDAIALVADATGKRLVTRPCSPWIVRALPNWPGVWKGSLRAATAPAWRSGSRLPVITTGP